MVFFKGHGTPARLTPKRLGLVMVLLPLYTLLEAFNWLGFLLDEILFPGYREQEIVQPVFIVGNPRSGTTFLQRLMAKDTQTFMCLRTWEILFAPSVTQRKLVFALGALDRWLGKPAHRLVRWLERHLRRQTPVHRVGIRTPEEDEYLLLHIWSTILIGLATGFPDLVAPYSHFDEALSEQDKQRIMNYYRRCLQRHIYAHGEGRRLLSKNPYFSPKIDALYATFPDAHIIYLARNPLSVIPSYTSLSAYSWQVFCDARRPYPFREMILDLTQYWYHYPVERLVQAPEPRYCLLNFNTMIDDPEQTLSELYAHFKITLTPDFAQTLHEEAEKARHYQSKHAYSLESTGYTEAQILDKYAGVFARWGFDRQID